MESKPYVVLIGDSDDPDLVGGKGASLTRMLKLKLNVPPGLTITTEAWRAWRLGVLTLEELYADHVKPVLKSVFPNLGHGDYVSVRSGAAVSMPGMMETLLWAGSRKSRHYVKYLSSYVKAIGLDESVVDGIVDKYLLQNGTFLVSNIYNASELAQELEDYAGLSNDGTKEEWIDSQLIQSIKVVFESWDSPKAKTYRETMGLSDDAGTACTIQRMVDASAGLSGVMLTRGDIEWIAGEQGDAVVDGKRQTRDGLALSLRYPAVHQALIKIGNILERAYHDAMDVEFTYDGEKLYILQCRPVKRTPIERMRIVMDLYEAGLVSPDAVLNTPTVDDSVTLVEPTSDTHPLAKGIAINGKLLTGKARLGDDGCDKSTIAIRYITTTNDLDLMQKCGAVVSLTGGPTCHAALVARELHTTAVVGADGYFGTDDDNRMRWSSYDEDWKIYDGDLITITPDGRIYPGAVELETKVVPGETSAQLDALKRSLLEQIEAGQLDRTKAKIDIKPKRVRKPKPVVEENADQGEMTKATLDDNYIISTSAEFDALVAKTKPISKDDLEKVKKALYQEYTKKSIKKQLEVLEEIPF